MNASQRRQQIKPGVRLEIYAGFIMVLERHVGPRMLAADKDYAILERIRKSMSAIENDYAQLTKFRKEKP